MMLKIDAANIHAEMVSGNSMEMDGVPALKTPYRKKLARAGTQAAHSKAGTVCIYM